MGMDSGDGLYNNNLSTGGFYGGIPNTYYGNSAGNSGSFGVTNDNYFNGIFTGGGLPSTTANMNAPTYDLSTPYGNYALSQTINSGNAGSIMNGISAFMPNDWMMPSYSTGSGSDADNGGYMAGGAWNGSGSGTAIGDIMQLAKSIGYDTSGYDTSSEGSIRSLFNPTNSIGNMGANGQKTLSDLYKDMDSQLQNYYTIQGMSSGWDGSDNARSGASTMYYRDGNTLSPITDPQKYIAPEYKGGYFRNEGADVLAAASMIMPAFGGWAGILGNGVGGTLTAGSGLGLTSGLSSAIGSGLTNGLVNGAVNGALSGGTFNPVSMLPGLGMSALGQLSNGGNLANLFADNSSAISNASYGSLGQLMNSGIGQSIMRTPFFQTQEGNQLAQLLGQGRSLASLFGA